MRKSYQDAFGVSKTTDILSWAPEDVISPLTHLWITFLDSTFTDRNTIEMVPPQRQ
jgi:hypothetical protein